MAIEHAYALLHVKQLNVDARTVAGYATTPELDRQGHTVDPKGATYKNPLPFLFFHDQRSPIGKAVLDAPTDEGIPFTAEIARVTESGPLRDRLDEAWQSIQAKLITGVSIGFRVLENGIKWAKDGTAKITKYEIVELSLVTIPANMHASILTVKSLAALGPSLTTPPGVSGSSVVRFLTPTPKATMSIKEHIAKLEESRTTKAARMTEIMQKSADDGITLNDDQRKEYDGLALEVKTLDGDLGRLRELEKTQLVAATPITAAATGNPALAASAARGGQIQVKSTVEPGTAFVRAACAMLVCKGNFNEAAEYARRWDSTTPEVSLYLKAAVAAGNTTDATWAGPLVNPNISADFLALLRPATILGKIPGLRSVPFNTKVPSQTAGGTYGWVGEAKPKPVTKLAFSSATLGVTKTAGIVVLTEELVRLSNPSAEALVRADMIAGIAQFLDQQFIDPAVAAVAGINPASITNGAPTAVATANPLADMLTLISHFSTNNIPIAGLTFIMSEANALSISFRTNADGSPQFPGVSITGGTYRGINIVTSQAAGGNIIALQPSLILYADDGGVTIDASREASVQMDSAPMSPADATTVYVSLWQNNLVGLRAERFVNWLRANANAVKYLTAAAYPAPTGPAALAAAGPSVPAAPTQPGRA